MTLEHLTTWFCLCMILSGILLFIFFTSESQGFYVFWTKIRSWTSHCQGQSISFEISMTNNSMSKLTLTTSQAQFLHSVVSETINVCMVCLYHLGSGRLILLIGRAEIFGGDWIFFRPWSGGWIIFHASLL